MILASDETERNKILSLERINKRLENGERRDRVTANRLYPKG